MNVHSLSTVTFAPPWDLIAPPYHKPILLFATALRATAEPSEGGWAVVVDLIWPATGPHTGRIRPAANRWLLQQLLKPS